MKLIVTCAIFLALAGDVYAESQSELLTQNSFRKKRRKRIKKPQPATQIPDEKQLEEKLTEEAMEEVKSAFFPDWKGIAFDWGLRPILGLQYTKIADENGSSDVVSTEAGLAGYLQGIPVVPGNPGFYISPRLGKAWGSVDSKASGATKTESVKYNRTYGGADFVLNLRVYRHTLGVLRGVKEFSVTEVEKVQSMQIMNDFGFLILSWFSGHLTHTHLTGFADKYSTPFLKEQDYWIHSRIFTEVLSFFIDVGPGFTQTEEFSVQNNSSTKIADGQIQYLKLQTGLHLFWKIGATGHAKYIYKSDSKDLGNFATITLPDQALNEPRRNTMPEDSLTASAFFGIQNLVGGFGLGWRYNVQILNMSEKDGKEKIRTEDNGFVFTYTASL